MKKGSVVGIALTDISLLGIGVFGSWGYRNPGWLSFALGSIALATFFWFLQDAKQPDVDRDQTMQRAIAGTVVLVYVLLITTYSFYVSSDPVPPITSMLLTSFTTTVGVIVAFYFGS